MSIISLSKLDCCHYLDLYSKLWARFSLKLFFFYPVGIMPQILFNLFTSDSVSAVSQRKNRTHHVITLLNYRRKVLLVPLRWNMIGKFEKWRNPINICNNFNISNYNTHFWYNILCQKWFLDQVSSDIAFIRYFNLHWSKIQSLKMLMLNHVVKSNLYLSPQKILF